MTLEDFERWVKFCRENGVLGAKLGDAAIQLSPELPSARGDNDEGHAWRRAEEAKHDRFRATGFMPIDIKARREALSKP